jgi:hypothetical protein
VKKKLIIILAIIGGIQLIIFFSSFIYFIVFDNSFLTDDASEFKIEETNKLDNSDNNSKNEQNDFSDDDDSDDNSSKSDYVSDKPQTVIINGVDVSSNLQVKEIDSIMYANAQSFIESFAASDMSPGMRYFNYEFIKDSDTIKDYLSEYSPERGSYLNDEFSHLLDLDAILVISWFTETPECMLFIGSTDVIRFGEINQIITIDEAPQIIDDSVYIPMEAFANISGIEIEIKD